jgi:hypothetical protein
MADLKYAQDYLGFRPRRGTLGCVLMAITM